ncbi:MAG TPA: hypothetical protein DCS12_10845 [Clostridiales bacterium]|nr:hypothetical protein [Clostridiales bacterium]
MIDILYIGGIVSDQHIDADCIDTIDAKTAVNDILEWSFVKGLEENLGQPISIINAFTIPTFPKDSLWIKGKTWQHCDSSVNHRASFLNIFAIRNFSRKQSLSKLAIQWAKLNPQHNKAIVVYTTHSPFLCAAVAAKRTNSNIRICNIIPDLPAYTKHAYSWRRPLYSFFRFFDLWVIARQFEKIDCYAFFSEHMKEKIDVSSKKFRVVEGVANPSLVEIKQNVPSPVSSQKTVFYAGGISKRNGIELLLDSINYIEDPDIHFILCGQCNDDKLIKKMEAKRGRLQYKGLLSKKEVCKLQQEATVLINPRTADGDFTRYSFPSKTLDYLASGKPVICFALEGIPGEYDTFLHYIPENTPQAIAQTIQRICNLSEEERFEMGMRGLMFVEKCKNNVAQMKKITDMLKEYFINNMGERM